MIKKIFYGWWIVLACFLITFYVSGVAFYGLTAFIDPIIKEFHWNYTQVSFAASLRGLEMGIFSTFIGFLVDRFGSRRLIFWGIITVGVGMILLGLTQSLLMLYTASLILAFGAGGCTSVVTMTAVANWFRRNIGLALGIMVSGFGASGLIVPWVVWLIDFTDWRIALIIMGLGAWLIGIPLAFVVRDKPEAYGCLPDGDEPHNTDFIPEYSEEQQPLGFKEAFKKKTFVYLNIAEAIRIMVLAAVVVHIMPYLGSMGISRSKAAVVASAIPLFSIIGRLGFGWLGDRFEKKYMQAFAFFLMALAMFALCFPRRLGFTLLFLLLFSPGFGAIMVLRGSILREYYGRDSFGKLIGIIMGSAAVGGIIGPTLAGWVFDTTGGYRIVWLIFGGALFIPLALTLRLKPEAPVIKNFFDVKTSDI
jgi:MFS family permease